ncbi:MAG TPA: deoxynucleoside kinase [Calditrichia bacterium]|nr:deoxynucleoside kinase [Calditrichota bacterium]HQU72513.1 deoxynucleoside kinase [Calditrichia bacterium]HQV30816.1 deoxynucleoside kinase [Calditrichia bacterium]
MTHNFDDLRYIAIEGVIGVGKTSLANRLRDTLEARLFLEEFEENPFLKDFYKDPKRYAFQVQLFFLLSRFRQQEEIVQYDLFSSRVVADYMFQKDRIFATLNLEPKEFKLYDMLASILEQRIVKPDLVIYLRSSTDRLMANIAKRGRQYEKDMSRDYIESLNRLYDEYFWNYEDTPLLIINMENIDFVNNRSHLEQVFTEIARHRSGRKNVTIDLGKGE